MKTSTITKKLCFLCYNTPQPWIKRDLRILRKHFALSVLPVYLESGKIPGRAQLTLGKLASLIRMFNEIRKADLTFGWFASVPVIIGVLISRLLRKRSIVVVGGFDVESMPEIGYGNMQHARLRRFIAFGLKQADLVLPFSEYAGDKVRKLTGNQARMKIANLACDTGRFKPAGAKEALVITAGFINRENVARKGLMTFVAAARYLPQVKFYLIGRPMDDAINELKAMATPNVVFPGYLPDDGLLALYQRAKVFCLLSYQEGEGGGGVLGEAMACGCIPVVSEKAVALRETAGDCGFYVPYGNAEATVEAIKKALQAPEEQSQKARERIERLYSMENRERVLLEAIGGR